MKLFHDRKTAGIDLAKKLEAFHGQANTIVIGLPRGGVVVAAEVAQKLELPLDIIVTRKIPAESDPEYAIGALSETGEVIWNEEEKKQNRKAYLDEVVKREQTEAQRRLSVYRKNRPARLLRQHVVILVDDGIATGFTMRAAIQTAKQEGAKKIVVAVPHGASDTLARIKQDVDLLIALEESVIYFSVGQYYEQFPQVTDEEVLSLMK